jgi:hypothetical protein
MEREVVILAELADEEVAAGDNFNDSKKMWTSLVIYCSMEVNILNCTRHISSSVILLTVERYNS